VDLQGVELSRGIGRDEKKHTSKDYPDLDISKMQINLIQRRSILNTMSEKSSAA
jgi:NADH dehydrogenase